MPGFNASDGFDPDAINLSISGQAKTKLEKAADVLEVNSVSPILGIMIGIFCDAMEKYGKNEEFRLLSIVNPDTMQAMPLADLEEIRVKAKMIEFNLQ